MYPLRLTHASGRLLAASAFSQLSNLSLPRQDRSLLGLGLCLPMSFNQLGRVTSPHPFHLVLLARLLLFCFFLLVLQP